MPQRPPSFRPAYLPPRVPASDNRPNSHLRGYDHRWHTVARLYREAHPLCRGCESVGRITAAVLVDHIVPHKGVYALLWDEANFQSCCRWHHDVVKRELEQRYANGKATNDDLHLDSEMAKKITMES